MVVRTKNPGHSITFTQRGTLLHRHTRAIPVSGPKKDGGDFIPFEADQVEQSIPARFEEQVRRYGHCLALKTRYQELTYVALNSSANRVAHAILARCGSESEPVVLLLDKEAPLFIAMLGALKARKFYVVLLPSCPAARQAAVTEDSGAQLIVTDTPNLAAAKELAGGRLQVLNVEDIDLCLPDTNPGLAIGPDDNAYIIYTSGSTGAPKGVLDTHRNLLHNIYKYTNGHRLTAADRLACLNSCAFSNSLKDIFGSLLNGGVLLPLDIERHGLAGLVDWLVREEVTVLSVVATVYRRFVSTLTGGETFPSLRLIRVGSEAVTRKDLEEFQRFFGPDCEFANGYGSTETGTVRLFVANQTTRISDSILPIGYAVDGTEVVLLDDAAQPVEPGSVGQIAVRSRFLSPGYWRQPDLTATAFLPDPTGNDRRIYLTGDLGMLRPDGCLLYVGRKDFQVKIRGNRIETAEIELALLEWPGVKEAAVVARADLPEDKSLVGYVVTRPGLLAPSTGDLRNFLKQRLPDYAIPSVFVQLEALPLTTTGKFDRKALPAPAQDRSGLGSRYVAPRNEVECCLVRIWEKLLRARPVGVCDNFFEAGGHSLLAVDLFVRIRQEFGLELPLAELFGEGTIEQLARVIARKEKPKRPASLVAIQPHGTRPPLFCVHGIGGEVLSFEKLARHLGDDQPFYGFQARGLNGVGAPLTTLTDMAACYVEELLEFQPQGPYFLAGYSLGGVVAYEMAQQLRGLGHEVGLLAIIDQRHPDISRKVGWGHAALAGFLRNLPHWVTDELFRDGVGGIKTRFRALARKVGKQLATHLEYQNESVKPDVNEVFDLALVPDCYRQMLQTHYEALRAYRPQPYPGYVTLFRARTQPLLRWEEPGMGWKGLAAGGVEVQVVSGAHDSILQEPHVGGLARQLGAALRRACPIE